MLKDTQKISLTYPQKKWITFYLRIKIFLRTEKITCAFQESIPEIRRAEVVVSPES